MTIPLAPPAAEEPVNNVPSSSRNNADENAEPLAQETEVRQQEGEPIFVTQSQYSLHYVAMLAIGPVVLLYCIIRIAIDDSSKRNGKVVGVSVLVASFIFLTLLHLAILPRRIMVYSLPETHGMLTIVTFDPHLEVSTIARSLKRKCLGFLV